MAKGTTPPPLPNMTVVCDGAPCDPSSSKCAAKSLRRVLSSLPPSDPPSDLIPHLAGGSVPKPGDELGLIPEHQSITLRPGPRWRRQDGRQVSYCLQSAGVVNHASSRPASPHMCFIFLSSPHPSALFFLALYFSDSLSPSCISCGSFFHVQFDSLIGTTLTEENEEDDKNDVPS